MNMKNNLKPSPSLSKQKQKGTKKKHNKSFVVGFLLLGWLGDLCVSLFSLFRAPLKKSTVEVPDDSWVNGGAPLKSKPGISPC